MNEIVKLTAKVDRLITDVEKRGEKIDAVRHQISFVKGALWVLGGLIAFAVTMITIYLRTVAH